MTCAGERYCSARRHGGAGVSDSAVRVEACAENPLLSTLNKRFPRALARASRRGSAEFAARPPTARDIPDSNPRELKTSAHECCILLCSFLRRIPDSAVKPSTNEKSQQEPCNHPQDQKADRKAGRLLHQRRSVNQEETDQRWPLPCFLDHKSFQFADRRSLRTSRQSRPHSTSTRGWDWRREPASAAASRCRDACLI